MVIRDVRGRRQRTATVCNDSLPSCARRNNIMTNAGHSRRFRYVRVRSIYINTRRSLESSERC